MLPPRGGREAHQKSESSRARTARCRRADRRDRRAGAFRAGGTSPSTAAGPARQGAHARRGLRSGRAGASGPGSPGAPWFERPSGGGADRSTRRSGTTHIGATTASKDSEFHRSMKATHRSEEGNKRPAALRIPADGPRHPRIGLAGADDFGPEHVKRERCRGADHHAGRGRNVIPAVPPIHSVSARMRHSQTRDPRWPTRPNADPSS